MTSSPSGPANAAGLKEPDPPPAASALCQFGYTKCQRRTRLYRNGQLELEGFPVADISDYLPDESVTIWLDLHHPDPDDLNVLSEEFGLHPLGGEGGLAHRQPAQIHPPPRHTC